MADEKQIKIEVRGKIATLKEINFQMVGGNSDYKVVFDFDEDWDRHNTKTALFVFGNNKPVPKVFEGNICKGVAITNATSCYIGVFSGDIITSTPARIDCVFQSITDIGGTPEEPTPSVYNQIIELINKYISQGGGGTGGGGVSEEAVIEIIEKYLEENPVHDGLTPYIKDGYWWIGETNTNVKAEGEKGDKGDDYILTEADKTEIANEVRADLEDVIGDIDTALDGIIALQNSFIGEVASE